MKCLARHSVKLALVIACLFLLTLGSQPGAVSAQATTITLNFNSLPSAQGWVIYSTNPNIVPETSVYSVSGGLLHMDTINTGVGYNSFAYSRSGVVNAQLPFTITTRVRITDYWQQGDGNWGGFELAVFTGLEEFEVGISPIRIASGLGKTISTSVDVSQFHEYRMVAQPGSPGSFEFFIDNVSYGTFSSVLTNFSNNLVFGDITAGANAVTDIASYTFVQTQPFSFNGFFPPVDNQPTLNVAKAGSAIPVKFSLGGNKGLNIFAQGYPVSTAANCGAAAESAVEETFTANSSGLTYDASADQYIYVWKTDKAWANTCRTLVVKLTDGIVHSASFQFK